MSKEGISNAESSRFRTKGQGRRDKGKSVELSPDWSRFYFKFAGLTQVWFLFLLKSLHSCVHLVEDHHLALCFPPSPGGGQYRQRMRIQWKPLHPLLTLLAEICHCQWFSSIRLQNRNLGPGAKVKAPFTIPVSQKGCLNQPKGVSGFYKYWHLNLLSKYSVSSDVIYFYYSSMQVCINSLKLSEISALYYLCQSFGK